MQRMPYMSDPTIVPRVQKYLESNVDKTYVDINVMADELQRKYREYSKRKRSAFRASVNKAYAIVLQSYGLDDDQETSEEDELLSDESEEGRIGQEDKYLNNSMNNQLAELYTRPVAKQMDENELIDISSEDSEGPTAAPNTVVNNKPSNGASTSVRRAVPDVTLHKINVELPKENFPRRVEKHPSEASQDYERVVKKRKLDHASSIPSVRPYHRKKKSLAMLQEPPSTFKEIGGMDKTLEEVCKLLLHIKHPELYKTIGISPPRGFLLHGPPGCGKTLLANAIAGELNVPLLKVAAPELVAGVSGESEERIRELFERALKTAPCVLFIDEIDAITPNRQNAQKEMERRIVAQLLSCLDDLSKNELGSAILVIGATNRPDAIDPALRRAGRFDREIPLGIPDIKSRSEILKVLTSKLKLTENFDYEKLASLTPGFVGADLLSLTREAAMTAVNRLFQHLKEARLAVKPTPVEKAKKSAVVVEEKDDSKNSTEIVVDDDISVDLPTESVNGETPEPAVVVIDDDVANKTQIVGEKAPSDDTAPEKEKVEEKSPAIPEPEPMPVDVTTAKPTNPLEDLLSWLHDKSPFSKDQLMNLCVTMEDFMRAMRCVQPSAKREGFATVPDVTWDDVGSLRDVREDLQMAIVAPVRHAKQFEALGIDVPTGVLLCGPPGCGKTLLAKAIANEAGINFISVKGPELLNMYVGESERAVRVCFERARNSAPCVIFFDELDALCPKRSDSREGGATMRVVNQMLTEMDGVEGRRGVFLLAASNRPDIIDPAVLRPGRLDKILFVGLPTSSDRADILRAITKNGTSPRLSPDVSLEEIGKSEQCRGYTGADLAALVREAGVVALKEYMLRGGSDEETVSVTSEHFNRAIGKIRPSVTEKDRMHYEKLRKIYSSVAEQQTEEEEMELS